ncbi:class I SAM-dependent methyltransferase [Mycobacterium sp. HM-7]
MASDTVAQLRRHRADYGYDGDYRVVPAPVVAGTTAAISAGLLLGAARLRTSHRRVSLAAGLTGALIATTAAFFIHSTRIGKFRVWAEILAGLGLRGDETVLDMGCGRGAVLLAAAKLVPNGRAIGVDIWRADQTDNAEANTRDNAELEGVADRIELCTADMTSLPLPDNSVDLVVSSLAVHNIPERQGRARAISEAARVLRPGGRLVLADLAETGVHVRQLHELGWTSARRRNLGWRMWWGPGMSTYLVTAAKPAAGSAVSH